MKKSVAWMLLLVSSASFATSVVVGRLDERFRQVSAECRQPPAVFAKLFQSDAASGSAAAAIE